MKGTLLNTATVALGAGVGLLVGEGVPDAYREIALSGIGLVVVGIGIKQFLQTKNVLIVAAAAALGGVLGLALGIQAGLEGFAEWARQQVGGGGRFNEALITASILFCVGPMTLIGCLKDGLEGDSELLNVKSTMDGVAAFFFAATMGRMGGYGVLMSAAVVLVLQGTITVSARGLRRFADDKEYIGEATAVGGMLMLAIGLGLLEIKSLPVASYLPALILAPMLVSIGRLFSKPRPTATDRYIADLQASPPPLDPWPADGGSEAASQAPEP